MSIELGPSASYVYATEDGLNGSTREALFSTAQSMVDEAANTKVVEAVRTVAEHDGAKRVIMDEFREQGKYLFGTHARSAPTRSAEVPYDAVLYAEAEGVIENGGFPIVRLAGWMRKGVESRKFYHDNNIMGVLVDLCLDDRDDEEGMRWGVPVHRMTRVTPFIEGANFLPSAEEAGPLYSLPYIYGHKKDRDQLDRIQVPSDVKAALVLALGEYHLSEAVKLSGTAE